MLEVFGKTYYLDVDEIIRKCRPEYPSKDNKDDDNVTTEVENEETVLELNVFKFEVFKSCVERLLSEYEPVDDKLGEFAANESTSTSFKVAFNTLLKYDILIEDDNE